MADIKKEVADWEEDGKQESREEEEEEGEDTEDEGEEEDIDGYEEEEGKERWFNLSQLAEVRNTLCP